MIAGMTYYEIASYFLIYAFGGWCTEVIYQALKRGKIINRGFLNGPVCPVYGFGVLAVFALTGTFMPALKTRSAGEGGISELLILFLIGMILATLVELIAGWLLDVCFHARWWDYSNVPLNFHGYICLRFSVLWGLAIVFVVKVIQPIMEKESKLQVPENYGWPILAILYAVLLVDFIVTAMIVAGWNRKLTELDDIRKKMRIVSDGLSQKLGSETIEAHQKFDESRVQAHLAGAELKTGIKKHQAESLDKLRTRKAALEAQITKHRWFGAGRILEAFPDLRHREHNQVLEELREVPGSKD